MHRTVAAISFFSAAFALNTAIMYLTASRGLNFSFYTRMNWIGWFAIPAGLQFLYYFRSEASRTAGKVGKILYPFWAAVLVICLFTDLIVTPGYSLIPYRNQPGLLELPVRAAGSLMTLWLVVEIIRVRNGLSGIRKFQINLFFYGLLVYSIAGIFIAGIMPLIRRDGIEPGLGSYFSLPSVRVDVLAIVRHSLFEMRIIFSRTIGIIILLLVFSALQAAVLLALLPRSRAVRLGYRNALVDRFFPVRHAGEQEDTVFVDSLVLGNRYRSEPGCVKRS